MTLELLDGSLITPFGVFDVLDMVEEYMGPEVRQYLEDCFREENPWENLPDDEKVESLLDHYDSILSEIESATRETESQMHKSHVSRKQVLDSLTRIQNIIDKEREHYGKED